MNMKNITKSGLNSFIGRKVRSQKADLRAEIDQLINEHLNPVLNVYIDVRKVEDAAAKFADLMDGAIAKYKAHLGSWKYSDVIQKVNQYAVPLSAKIKDEVRSEMLEHIENPQKGACDLGNDELNKTLTMLQEKTKPLFKRINDLTKLQAELEHVIKNEPTGGRGYKALVALGVDMEGYEEQGVNLPAITKLSVDVCVINGNCEGTKESA